MTGSTIDALGNVIWRQRETASKSLTYIMIRKKFK